MANYPDTGASAGTLKDTDGGTASTYHFTAGNASAPKHVDWMKENGTQPASHALQHVDYSSLCPMEPRIGRTGKGTGK